MLYFIGKADDIEEEGEFDLDDEEGEAQQKEEEDGSVDELNKMN